MRAARKMSVTVALSATTAAAAATSYAVAVRDSGILSTKEIITASLSSPMSSTIPSSSAKDNNVTITTEGLSHVSSSASSSSSTSSSPKAINLGNSNSGNSAQDSQSTVIPQSASQTSS